MSWLTLPLDIPRRAIDDLQSVAESVLEIPGLLRELAGRLASMDEAMDRVSSAIVNVEDELQGVLAASIRWPTRSAECVGPPSRSTRAYRTCTRP